MTRSERQELCVDNWIRAGGRSSVIASTGFGKTRVAILAIKRVLTKYPDFKTLVVVPSTNLKDQWEENLRQWNLEKSCVVRVINTVIMHRWRCDILVIDELHLIPSENRISVFNKVEYKLVLGLTATYERLDGRESLLDRYCPVCDEITMSDVIANHWVADYVEYEVLIDVDNLNEYEEIQRKWTQHFEFFSFDFQLMMKMNGRDGFIFRQEFAKALCTKPAQYKEMLKTVTLHAIGAMQAMQQKKAFLNNHSKKIELARKIIEARPNAKIITFSNNIKMAEAIGIGGVVSGKESKKKNRTTLEEFAKADSGVVNSSKLLVAGADIPGVNCLIILGHDSSTTRATQARGRGIRVEGDKFTEIFNLVINDTQETKWCESAHKNSEIVRIDEANLEKVLRHEPFETYKRPLEKFNYRF